MLTKRDRITQPTGDEAIKALTHIAKDNLPSRDERDFVADVRDESGAVVFHGTL